MKKAIVLLAVLCGLGGCASLGLKQSCDGRDLARPSFFDQGQSLVAFKTVLKARGGEMKGILQIKKTEENSYQAVLFALAGGYKLMQAQVQPKNVTFEVLVPPADVAVVRAKAESFLTLLLWPPAQYKNCREQNGRRTVTYTGADSAYYEYALGESYPQTVVYRKTFGTARMSFAQYRPYEAGFVPHLIYYDDGSVTAELTLLTLKK